MDPDEYYDGTPVQDLPLTDVDVPDPDHLQRSRRYPGATDIDPAAAIEAALDWHGLIARDPNSATGEAIRIIGHSPTADRVLVVVLIPEQHPPDAAGTSLPPGRRTGDNETCTPIPATITNRSPHDDHTQP